jgi:hypothetical protein
MWDVYRDEWDLFDVAVILEVACLYCDETEVEATLFNDYGETNNLSNGER